MSINFEEEHFNETIDKIIGSQLNFVTCGANLVLVFCIFFWSGFGFSPLPRVKTNYHYAVPLVWFWVSSHYPVWGPIVILKCRWSGFGFVHYPKQGPFQICGLFATYLVWFWLCPLPRARTNHFVMPLVWFGFARVPQITAFSPLVIHSTAICRPFCQIFYVLLVYLRLTKL